MKILIRGWGWGVAGSIPVSSKLNSSIYLQTRNMAISIRFKARTNDFGTMNVIHLEDELLLIPTI